jgi:hypothetical protein
MRASFARSMGHRTPRLARCGVRSRGIEARGAGGHLISGRLHSAVGAWHSGVSLRHSRSHTGSCVIPSLSDLCRLRLISRCHGRRRLTAETRIPSRRRRTLKHGGIHAVLSEIVIDTGSRAKIRTALLNRNGNLRVRHSAAGHGDHVLSRKTLLGALPLGFSQESLLILLRVSGDGSLRHLPVTLRHTASGRHGRSVVGSKGRIGPGRRTRLATDKRCSEQRRPNDPGGDEEFHAQLGFAHITDLPDFDECPAQIECGPASKHAVQQGTEAPERPGR